MLGNVRKYETKRERKIKKETKGGINKETEKKEKKNMKIKTND